MRRRRAAIGAVALLAGVGGFALWAAQQPRVADHFGYALVEQDRLPGHFSYQGITYSNISLCAGADYCHPSSARRWTQADLAGDGIWPLKQVSTVATLFGNAHPVLEPANDPSMVGAGGLYASDVHPFELYVPASDGTYFLYQRPGGP